MKYSEAVDSGLVVIGRVNATAVFVNGNNEVAIQQFDQFGGGDDPLVIIPISQVSALVAALRRVKKEAEAFAGGR